ncbi:unnamed protein product [Rangifer tarandus platyrhynchus]|uniref:Uncharacterized protein n=1 Tax=Rangifer tarandus platyrhynchus TaxID=3082113 RepID=A0ABN8YE19_RANTA|nr:unnamed protein product [Rangifer tarandus platyrhynchus]
MTPFPGYKSPKYQANKAPGGGQDPRQASSHRSFPGGIQRPKAWATRTGLLPQAAERQGPGPPLHSAPIVAGPGGPSRESGGRQPHSPPAPRLGAAPGRVGPRGRALRCARLGSACGSGKGYRGRQPARPGRRGLAPAKRRSSPAAALSASAGGPRQKASPSRPVVGPPGREHAPRTGKFR